MTLNHTVEKQEAMGNGQSAAPGRPDSRRYSSRSSYGRSARKIFKLRIIVTVLSVALTVTIFGWVTANIKLVSIEDQFNEYQISSRQEISVKENQTAEVDRLKAENELLVKGIIPGLRVLEFDTTITIDDQYFRNIGFTLTGTSETKNYEYRIVLHNDSLNVVAPAVTVFLLDHRGIQVGSTVLSKHDATSKVEFNNLQPNETRSYTGNIGLNIQAEPKYFLVEVK